MLDIDFFAINGDEKHQYARRLTEGLYSYSQFP
jgi:hypothetical protein